MVARRRPWARLLGALTPAQSSRVQGSGVIPLPKYNLPRPRKDGGVCEEAALEAKRPRGDSNLPY